MKRSLWIVPIEPIESRYTKHWYEFIPKQIAQNIDEFDVRVVEAVIPSSSNTDGGFFNFADTIAFKSRQSEMIASYFANNNVRANDVFLFLDYWNPTAHNVRYMSNLLDVPVSIVGVCHAGAWDPADLLGQKFTNKSWALNLEKSFDELYDLKIFATQFSKQLYEATFGNNDSNKVTGFPMEYYDEILTPYWDLENQFTKEKIVVFPHRKSPEKNLNLFYELKKHLPEYEFIVAMDVCKTKDEYHNLLYRSSVCFSASLQETLGISMGIEALRCGCEVVVPRRLSYAEMHFHSYSFYPGYIANDYTPENKQFHVEYLADRIRFKMENFNIHRIKKEHDSNYKHFFNGTKFYKELKNCN